MEDDFHSNSKVGVLVGRAVPLTPQGVFVIPFQKPQAEAGPSRPRPLADLYDESYRRFEEACEVNASLVVRAFR